MEEASPTDTRLIRSEADRLYGVAMWIGRATEAANHWPAPSTAAHHAVHHYIRDSEASAVRPKPVAALARQPASVAVRPGAVPDIADAPHPVAPEAPLSRRRACAPN